MNELERALIGDSAAAPATHILEGLGGELAHRRIPGSPHSIYEELWHLTFWQQMSIDWIQGTETPFPDHASLGFPSEQDVNLEGWDQLCQRFLEGSQIAADVANDVNLLDRSIRCPSQPGKPARTMSVREQLESLAAHNAYHLGRIVLMRQLCNAWPPVSGGFTW
jgi:hypothetical protein